MNDFSHTSRIAGNRPMTEYRIAGRQQVALKADCTTQVDSVKRLVFSALRPHQSKSACCAQYCLLRGAKTAAADAGARKNNPNESARQFPVSVFPMFASNSAADSRAFVWTAAQCLKIKHRRGCF